MEDKQMYILANAISMLIDGYILNTEIPAQLAEIEKTLKIPKMLKNLANGYQEDIDSKF